MANTPWKCAGGRSSSRKSWSHTSQPDSARAYDALRKLLVARHSWDELEALFGARLEEYLRTLERQVELEAPPIKLELLLRMAVIFRDRLRRHPAQFSDGRLGIGNS